MPFLGASRSFPSTLPCLLLAILLFPRETLSSTEFHKHMTSEELQHVFQVSSHDEVPDYELVHIRSISKRDASSVDDKLIHVKAFGKDYSLRLEKNPHLLKSPNHLKVLLADIKNGTLQFEEAPPQARNFSENLGDPYHDTTNEAAVVIRHDKYGTLHMDGTIGKTLAIKPAPVSIKKEVNRKAVDRLVAAPADDEMFLDEEYPPYTPKNNLTGSNEEDDSYETNGLHIVFKRKRAELEEGSDYLLMEPDQSPVLSRRIRSFYFKREAPDTIWPEVLVIADYDTYSMHGGNSVNIKRYFVSFWNGVDLRYKLLVGPRVRISLAGIIISKGRDATPYLENNRVHGDAVDSAAALTDMGKYLFRERRLPTYDLAVVVTKLDLCRRQFQAGTCNTGTAGFAYVGGACVVNSRLEKVNSVAIVEDTGGFSGIIVAAHEVGHLLGAVHDGSPAPNYLGGPGAEHCRWEDGYIMSDLRHTERGFQWSSCSVQQFKHFLNSDTATCLHNIPHEDEELPRILPGKLLSLDAQCRKDRGTSACFKDDRVCAQLFCFDSKSGYCVSYRPAAEGSPCGEGHYCVNGRCIPELDNYISDFTKISETVVSKPDTPATEPRPLFSKQRSRTTQDSWSVTTTTVSPTRSRKFHYNTVVRKVSVERTTPSAFDDADPPPDQEIEDDVGRAQDRNDPGCEDVMQTLAGGLTCKQFLRNYGDRYCSHPFIVSNCCASREIVCNV